MSNFDYLKKVAKKNKKRKKHVVSNEDFTFLSVTVGDELMCLAANSVREIVPHPVVTPLGHVKPWYKGLMKAQGEIFSVIDLALFLGQAQGVSRQGYAVALQSESGQHAFLVDAVNGLVSEKILKQTQKGFIKHLATKSGDELREIVVEELIGSPEYNSVSVFN